MSQPLKTFICYAHEDHEVVEGLKKQLAIFEKKGLLQIWSDGKILAGEHWDKSIKVQLEQAEIILLFISVDFINSDYIEKTELQAALLRHRNGEATLIPIIVRHCHWEEYFDMGQFQALPSKARPILSGHFPHRDEAFFEIATGVKKTAEDLRERNLAAFAALAAEAQRAKEAEAKRAEEEAAAKALAVKEAAIRAEAEAAAKKEEEVKAAQLAATAKLQRSKDLAAWKAAIELNTIEAFEDYLEKYTIHEVEAHERIGKLEEIEAKRRAEQKVKDKAEAARKAKEAELVAEAQRAKDEAEKEAEKKRKQAEAARKKREQEVALAAEAQRAAVVAEQKRETEEAARRADPFHDLMIPIKGGTFDMGDTFGDGGVSEKPVHKVTVRDFQLCKYPVTQAQWKAIMGNNPSSFKGDDLPVEKVSWDDAQKFLQKLNEKTGKKYRLPSEGEWEYAAREGGKKVRFGNGKDIADPKEMNFNGKKEYKKPYSIEGEYRSKTTPVILFKPNALGLHEMSGNVWEWCQDVWHETYKDAPEDGSAWEKGGDKSRRVLRGGSCGTIPEGCRAVYRIWPDPSYHITFIGFRIVRDY